MGAEEVGQLPEIPSFPDLMLFLTPWAARERKAAAMAKGGWDAARMRGVGLSFESAPPPDVLQSLQWLEGDWLKSAGDPEVARLACRALLWLHLQTADDLQLTDPILGKALALLALAPLDNSREMMLLAHQLGYEKAALDAASGLPPDDPDRLFVERRDGDLAALAASRRNPRIEFLHLLRVAARGDGARLSEALSTTSWAARAGAPPLGLLVRGQEFGTAAAAADSLKATLFAEVFSSAFPHPRTGPPSLTERLMQREIPAGLPERHLRSFESRLSKQARRMGGRLLDPETIQAYYLSGVYTAIHTTAQFLFDRFSSSTEAREFAASLTDLPSGTASDLHRWMSSRVALLEGAPHGFQAVQEDLANLRRIGVVPLARIRYSLRWANRWDWGMQTRSPMRGFFDSLDTRPSNLWVAGSACTENLQDIKRAEPYLKAAAAASPILGDRQMPWVSRLAGDVPALWAQARDASLTIPVRAFAMKSLVELPGCDLGEIETMYLALAREEREGMDGIRGYVDMALRRGDRVAALAALSDWVDAPEKKRGLAWAHAQTLRASILRSAGRLREAKDANDRALGSWTASSIEEGVEILIALGQLEDAGRLALAGIDRYPEGGEFPALLAECSWRQGDAPEAARVLRKARPRMSQEDWRSVVGRRFATGLATRDPALAERVFEAFLPVQEGDFDLDYVADEIEKAGNPALAARLLSKVGENDLVRIVRIFQLREKSEGREAALAWLRPRIPRLSPQFPLYVFVRAEDELLWSAYEGVPNAADAEILQLMRAAAVARSRRFDDPRAQEVRAFFTGPKARALARAMGLHLLGGGDHSLVWRVARNDEQRAIAAWALAVRAESEGDLSAANEWYQVTFELGRSNGPTRWFAFLAVEKWKDQTKFFSRVAADARR